jgi:hypothetical protein
MYRIVHTTSYMCTDVAEAWHNLAPGQYGLLGAGRVDQKLECQSALRIIVTIEQRQLERPQAVHQSPFGHL